MKRSKASEWLIEYIKEQKIAIKQMSFDLKIEETKLRGEGEEEFTSNEFLDLCHYLNITPEKIREEIEL